ncbi:anthranilate phosphoribosyltransferase [Paraburkholderia hayleyella]|uniref:anthranilate phosphoribosyltransferase n=1 Tax=Paraburkholderia hayleyella TaxID=2152889 RepID=UPI001FE5740A|nr:anthranilate phosphoribosyltransferase [Paraburkholderia hayleyella]
MPNHIRKEVVPRDLKWMINHLVSRGTLSRHEMITLIDSIVSGEASHAQIGAMLTALRMRGETIDEIVGAALSIRAHMVRLSAPSGTMDILGTGGDNAGTYNVSTCAAFVVAGTGVRVAKQGNRAFSSKSGSADVLQSLGVNLDLAPDDIAHCITEVGIGFMFAPAHHPALKQVMSVRVDLGTRTIFNILGPLVNPASVKRHLVGVYSRRWVRPLAQALAELGSERALVVHGSDGLDEITTTGPTFASMVINGRLSEFTITPEMSGLSRVRPEALKGGNPQANADALREVLEGKPGPYRDIALLNAAGALIAAGEAEDWLDAMRLACASIDEGKALLCLQRLIEVSNRRSSASQLLYT